MIPLTGANIYMASAITEMSVDELLKRQREAEHTYKVKHDREWAIEFFDKDDTWYDEVTKKVKDISADLPKDMDHRERTIKLYGWIADMFPNKYFSIPMEMNTKYAAAYCVKLILTNPSGYLQAISWD